MKFSDVLLSFRARHELTQTETAEILGCAQADISGYEVGRKSPTQRNRLLYEFKLCKYEEDKKGDLNNVQM